MSRMLEGVWRALTWRPLAVILAAVVGGMIGASQVLGRTTVNSAGNVEQLRPLLPGVIPARDLLHSLPFLVAALALAAMLLAIAVDLLVSRRTPGPRWFAEVGFWSALAAALVFGLLHVFLYREAIVSLGPGETVVVPGLNVTVKAEVTGWRPVSGSLARLQLSPHLSTPSLAGPFGEQDRSKDAKLSTDAVDLDLEKSKQVQALGLTVRLAEPPPGWAARLRLSSGGQSEVGPFLQSGQAWTAAGISSGAPWQVVAERVLPDFRSDVSIIDQPLGGPAARPAAVLAVYKNGVLVGSQAIAPGEAKVIDALTVGVDGFAPVVEISLSRHSWFFPAALALAVSAVCGGLWLGTGVVRRRSRGTGGRETGRGI